MIVFQAFGVNCWLFSKLTYKKLSGTLWYISECQTVLIQNVGPDLGPNCLQSLSAGNKSHLQLKSQQTKDNNKSMKNYPSCKELTWKLLSSTYYRSALTLCPLEIFFIFLSSPDFFKINFFTKNSFRNTFRVSNRFDPDQAKHLSDLFWVLSVCKGYKQTTLIGNNMCGSKNFCQVGVQARRPENSLDNIVLFC